MRQPRKPPPWDERMMMQAELVALSSKNPGSRFGAIICTQDHIVVSTGFNGPPPGFNDEIIPWDPPEHRSWIIHAEENALWFAALSRGWAGLHGCTLYVNGRPCSGCILRIARAGIAEVVFRGNGEGSISDEKDWELAQRIMSNRKPPLTWRKMP